MLVDGAAVAGAAAQPRRLAVLALLARAGRAGLTREKILALLWPDEPEDRARRSLNQAVYSLRRDLGSEGALLGSKDLRLNLDQIEVDVIEFDDAVRTGDVERAIALYAGPFLDGFFVPRAPELERWIEGERTSLAHEHAAALERAAQRASERGDRAAAITHWRTLAATDPLNGRIALSVMNALVAVGDPTGAIEHARLHEALLDQELGLPPDRDVAGFARKLRERVAAVVEAPRPIELPPEVAVVPPEPGVPPAQIPGSFGGVRQRSRRWIAAAAALAFIVMAAAGVIVRRGSDATASPKQPVVAVGTINDYASADSSGVGSALRDMLATNLARSPDLTVVSGSRLLDVERQMTSDRPSATNGIAPVARQAGATTLVDGAIYRLGADTLRLDLRLTSLRDGNVLRAYTVTGRNAFELADSATARLVAYLGSTVPNGSVADATTRSVTAYRFYEEGLRSYYLGDLASSERLFDAAIVRDSTFAMAAYYFALTTRTTRAEYIRRLRRAVTLAARASDRERLIIQTGWAETNKLRSLGAIAETLATRYPTEVEGHYYLGRALVNAGSFLEAIAPLRRVEIMDSLSLHGGDARCVACDALEQQVAAYALADSLPAAERVARRWLAARPNSWTAYLVLGRLLGTMGRAEEAEAAFRKSDSLDARGSLWEPMSTMWTQQGEFSRADDVIRSELAKGRGGAGDTTNTHWFLAISLRHQGRLAEALGEARAFRRSASGVEPLPSGAADPGALQEAQVLRELRRYRESAALFDSISKFTVAGAESSAVESGRVWSLTHEAGALAAGGDTARLAALADTIESYGSGSNLGRDVRIHHHVRGLLMAARGDDSAAVTEFRRAIYSPSLGYTRTNVEMAKSLIRLGRYGDAIAILEPALRGSVEGSNLYATYPEIRLLLAAADAGDGKRDRARRELDSVRRSWSKADAIVRLELDSTARVVAARAPR